MKARVYRGNIQIKVDDPKIIYRVRQIKNNRWDTIDKSWYVPVSEDAISKLETWGFNIEGLKQQLQAMTRDQQEMYNFLLKESHQMYPFLKKFQRECFAKAIINGNLLIADEMGLGKTVESLAIADYRLKKGDIDHFVICCPQSIKWQWKDEIKKFYPHLLKNTIIVQGQQYQRKEQYNEKKKVYIINYEQLLPDFLNIYRLTRYQLFIIDEASKVKNPKAKRTQRIKRLIPRYILGLTGTPVENKLIDAYTIANIIHPEWMTKYDFYNDYCVFTSNFGFKSLNRYKNVDVFMNKLMRIGIRRKRDDVTNMPKRIIYDRIIERTPSQKALGEKIRYILKEKIKREGTGTTITEYVLLPMVENSTDLIKLSTARSLAGINKENIKSSSAKMTELRSILNEVNGSKTVIFTRFKRMAKIIRAELGDAAILGTGDTNKEEVIKSFKEKHKYLVATDAYAYGVNMPFANVVINFDIPWNHAVLKQRMDRVYRLDQKKEVMVINLISDGLESYIFDVMKGKSDLFEKVVAFDLRKQLMNFILSD